MSEKTVTVYDPQGEPHQVSQANAADLLLHDRFTTSKPAKVVDVDKVDAIVLAEREKAKEEARRELLEEQKREREEKAAEEARKALEADEAAKKLAADLAAQQIVDATGGQSRTVKPTAEDLDKAPRAQLLVIAAENGVTADGRTSEGKLREALKAHFGY